MDSTNEIFSVIPEVVIYNTLKLMIEVTENNTKNREKELQLLWRIFGGNDDCHVKPEIDGMFLYEQSLKIFEGNKANRGIGVSIGYNLQRVETGEPSIHILLPSETTNSSPIGMNQGYLGNVIQDGEGYPILEMDTDVTYNLMITADNVNEMMIVYNWLKACTLSFSNQFSLLDFKNIRIGGNDLQFNDELIPPHIFHRNFNLSFTYEILGIDLLSSENLMNGKDFDSCGIIVEK